MIIRDKFDSHFCDLDEIRIDIDADDFHSIIKKGISDTLIITIEEYYYSCRDLLVSQYMMISADNDNEILV